MIVTVGTFLNMTSPQRRAALRTMPRPDAEKLIRDVFAFAQAEVKAASSVRGPGVGSWLSKAFGKVKDSLGDIIAVAAPIVSAVVPGAAPIIAAVATAAGAGSKPAAQPAAPQIQYVQQAPAQAAAGSGGLVLVGLAALVLLGSRR